MSDQPAITVLERDGSFVPSKLLGELRAAGVDCLGVTCTEDEQGNVAAVQIICAEDAAATAIDAVCEAHVAEPAVLELARSPLEQLVDHLATLPAGQPVVASDLLAILRPEEQTADA